MVFTRVGTYNHAGGDLTVASHYNAAAGSATPWNLGTELVVAYLGQT